MPKIDSSLSLDQKKYIRSLEQQQKSIDTKLETIDNRVETIQLSSQAQQYLSAAADASKNYKAYGMLPRDIDGLSVNALNTDNKVGFSFTIANTYKNILDNPGGTVNSIKIKVGNAAPVDVNMGNDTLGDLFNDLSGTIVLENNTDATANGVRTITNMKFNDQVTILSYNDGAGDVDLNITPTQLFNKLGINSTNSVTLTDGLLKADGTGYDIVPGTKIGLEPNNSFKIPGFSAVRINALKTGDFNVTADNVLENITKGLDQYSSVAKAAREFQAISGKNTSVLSRVGSKNITYSDFAGNNKVKNAFAFGITITDTSIQINENIFESAIREDYVGAVNFFNSLFTELRIASDSLVGEMQTYQAELNTKNDELQAKIDKIIDDAEIAAEKAQELEKKLLELDLQFERQMKMLSQLFGFDG